MRPRRQSGPITSLVTADLSAAPPPGAPVLDRAHRRKQEQERRRLARRTAERPLTMADVPPGSILSERTLAAIAAGQLALQVTEQPRTSPTRSRGPRLRSRRRTSQASRRRNRRR